MPSPFSGMDPYLEDPVRWPDVHQSLITYIRDALQPQIRPRSHARMGERVYALEPPPMKYRDVVLTRRPIREPAAVGTAHVVEVAVAEEEDGVEPILISFPPTEHREPCVEIVHAAGEEVVTVIEVLSPANKIPGEGRRLYHRKQQEILDSPVHLLEIDLLAEGMLAVAIPEEVRVSLPPHRYLVSVKRAPERYCREVYPILLQRRLPRVRIPLREPDVTLGLRAVFTRCYDNGGYADLVDYRRPPRTSLSPEEAAWVDGLLTGKGLRE